MMQYGNAYQNQRNISNVQNVGVQNVGVLQMPQQHQQNAAAGRMINMPNGNNQQLRRDQQFHGLQPNSDSILNSGAQMALLLDPNNPNALASSHITAQQRSDLVKHVHAKPFEPTSATPPLMQSPPVMGQQSMGQHPIHSRQIIPTVFCQPGTASTAHHIQNISRYSQPLIQQTPQQRQATIQPMQQQNQMVAPVRPRSVHGHSLSSVSPSATMNTSANSMSSFDANIALFAKNLSMKSQLGGANAVNLQQLHVSPLLNSQYTHGLQLHQQQQPGQQQGQRNPVNHALNATLQSRTSTGLGPIQRPTQIAHQMAQSKQPFVSTGSSASSGDGDFRKSQRQKMLEDTKKYFQKQDERVSTSTEQQQVIVDPSVKQEKQISIGTTDPNLAKHDKYILPAATKDSARKYEMKKNQRSAAAASNDQFRNRNYSRRQQPSQPTANDTSKTSSKQPSASSTTNDNLNPSQNKQRNIVS